MLILSRRENESIVIGDNEVTLTILSVKGKQVRIGITAPPEVSVHRHEIYDKIKSNDPQPTEDNNETD